MHNGNTQQAAYYGRPEKLEEADRICYFMAVYYNCIGTMDADGNSDIEMGLRIAYKERTDKKVHSKTFSDYINYLGQYANMPSESFSSTSENLFSSEALMNWEEILKNDPTYTDIADDGMFFEDINHKVIFKTNARIKAEGGKFNVDYFDWIQGVPRKPRDIS